MDFQEEACWKYAERHGISVTEVVRDDCMGRRWYDRLNELTSYCAARRDEANIILMCGVNSFAEGVMACEELGSLRFVPVPKSCEADRIGRFLDAVEAYRLSITNTEK